MRPNSSACLVSGMWTSSPCSTSASIFCSSYASALMFLLRFSSNMVASDLHFQSRFLDIGQRNPVLGILLHRRVADHDVSAVVLFQSTDDHVQSSNRLRGLHSHQPAQKLLIVRIPVQLSIESRRG